MLPICSRVRLVRESAREKNCTKMSFLTFFVLHMKITMTDLQNPIEYEYFETEKLIIKIEEMYIEMQNDRFFNKDIEYVSQTVRDLKKLVKKIKGSIERLTKDFLSYRIQSDEPMLELNISTLATAIESDIKKVCATDIDEFKEAIERLENKFSLYVVMDRIEIDISNFGENAKCMSAQLKGIRELEKNVKEMVSVFETKEMKILQDVFEFLHEKEDSKKSKKWFWKKSVQRSWYNNC